MRSVLLARIASLVGGGLVLASVPFAGAAAGTASGPPMRARITGAAIPGTSTTLSSGPGAAPSGLPSKKQQIKVLTAALKTMHRNYVKFGGESPGPMDVFDYGIGPLWRKGIDGAGTAIAVLEGWDFPGIAKQVAAFDKRWGLPNPKITTIFPAGKMPAKCPPGMVALGSYLSCDAWQGELTLDVIAAHLMAPYAKIVISVTPADQEVTDDPASQDSPPEMMKAVEVIAARHLANVISISTSNGEFTYSHGAEEITAQDPGELAAAAAGIPVLVATGDCGMLQNLPVLNGPCGPPGQPDTAAWDDSPWVTAVGGSTPNLNLKTGRKAGPDRIWNILGPFSEGAGFSSVFTRPSFQDGVAHITGSPMRSVPDITLDAMDGTSESAPLLGGVLALATQLNHGRNVGPINPALYGVLGPRGAAGGIADVIHGDNSVRSPVTPGKREKILVQGFTAAKGFDVASGWGTINGNFVPALVAATRASGDEAAARHQARNSLAQLTRGISLAPRVVAKGGSAYLLAGGFLPGHPVQLSVDGKAVATLTAGDQGTVTFMIVPRALTLAPGRHAVRLDSLLLSMTGSFRTS